MAEHVKKSRPMRPAPAWASNHGILNLSVTPTVMGLSIRDQLAERLHRYCWAFDERNAELLSECFIADAIWAGHVMGETKVGPHRGRDAIMTYLTTFWQYQRDQRRHVITNVLVESLDAEQATCIGYLLLLGSKHASTQFETAGFYKVDYRREGETWRISRLTACFDSPYWKQEVEEMEPWVKELFGITRHEPAIADE
jgi:hypothetical protein